MGENEKMDPFFILLNYFLKSTNKTLHIVLRSNLLNIWGSKHGYKRRGGGNDFQENINPCVNICSG